MVRLRPRVSNQSQDLDPPSGRHKLSHTPSPSTRPLPASRGRPLSLSLGQAQAPSEHVVGGRGEEEVAQERRQEERRRRVRRKGSRKGKGKASAVVDLFGQV